MKTKSAGEALKPKYARIHSVRDTHGLSEGTLYRMIHAGLIRSVEVRMPGRGRGTRLVDLESLDSYMASLAEAQS
jgi:hypothetical protein